MSKFMKENVANVNVGNALFCAPQREPWNSFSKPVRDIDRYPRSKKTIGKLNQALQDMKM